MKNLTAIALSDLYGYVYAAMGGDSQARQLAGKMSGMPTSTIADLDAIGVAALAAMSEDDRAMQYFTDRHIVYGIDRSLGLDPVTSGAI